MSDYKELYRAKLMSADDVAAKIPNGSMIATDLFLAQPRSIFGAINKRCEEDNIHDCAVTTALDLYPLACYKDPKYLKNLHGISFFCSGHSRPCVNSGMADFLPFTYWDGPAVIRDNIDYDVYVVSVAPMDENGYFSLGVTGSVSSVYIDKAKIILLEVNDKMPYCLAGLKIHISQVTALCEASYTLPAMPAAALDETSIAIGNLIAEEIPNGACLQLGIGGIPDAVGMALKSKRNLGIHTEMLTDSMIELIECGAVDNRSKQTHVGKTVATFAFGSQRIYDYVNRNPAMEILPVEYVNNPYNIAQNDNFISVNAALEVDLMGQVCSESMGPRMFSGSGGQLDFVRGAVMSKGGKSFIAFPAAAKGNTITKIKPILTPGSIVTTGRNDVDMIVTEYGIAKLRGKTMSQRARNLIAIAHPDFRDELTFEAKKMNLIV